MISEELVKRFISCFTGLNRGYGIYELKNTDQTGQKLVGTPSTKSGTVTTELYLNHLMGTSGLGICPIMDGNNCWFGAIDIDKYGVSFKHLLEKIATLELPLVPCKTKSGGLHLFCFVKEPIPAALMQQKLTMMASYLGVGDSEIFPKQIELLTLRNDIGSWINLPYFDYTKTKRFMTNSKDEPFPIEQFFEAVDKNRWNKAQFSAYTLVTVNEITDGPPCLQTLLQMSFAEGYRNQALFNLAIYLKKVDPTTWETMLDEYNVKFADPPLSSTDIQTIIKSVRKKDYGYGCDKPPLKNYCNVALCRSRVHGVGSLSGSIILTNLSKYNSEPPIWFADVEGGGRIELTTEELQVQNRFQRRCMESLNMMPIPVKPIVWQSMLQDVLKTVTIIEAAVDSSPRGLLFEYLERFCTSRLEARSLDEILLGKPWSDDTHHWFRLSDFYAFLDRVKFREFKVHQISSMLTENGGKHEFLRIKGKGVNVWKFPIFEHQQTEKFDVPAIENKEYM
jgi:hypothetical protein